MTLEVLEKINAKEREAITSAREIGQTNSAKASSNFNQIKEKDFSQQTYWRRHGLARDEVKRGIILQEFTADFYADVFASHTNLKIYSSFIAGLFSLTEKQCLPQKQKTPWEIQDEIDELLRQYRNALIVMDEEKARKVAVLIRQKSNELVEQTHLKNAFAQTIN